MKQYQELKRQAGDALLLFRMGDFYELFGDDAIEASKLLEITLTSRDRTKPNPVPMAGVPHHSVSSYIQKLLKVGKKVAIGDQVGDASAAKGIVPRVITRILTPALNFETDGAEARYLSTCASGAKGTFSLAVLDPATGEARVAGAMDLPSLISRASTLPIRHFLKTPECPEELARLFFGRTGVLVEELAATPSEEEASRIVKRAYAEQGLRDLRAFFPEASSERAFSLLISYALKSQKQENFPHLRLPLGFEEKDRMSLAGAAADHLDLFPSDAGVPSLFERINRTRSSLGARALRGWLASPLCSPDAIRRRQEAVQILASSGSKLDSFSSRFSEVYDLERIAGRLSTGLASPRDVLALGKTLSLFPDFARQIEAAPGILQEAGARLRELEGMLEPLAERIVKSLQDPVPLAVSSGDLFRAGVDPDLDRLTSIARDGESWLIALEMRERERLGIPTLKVKYNRVYGYSLEIPLAYASKAPPEYIRKQTVAGAERFITEELKRFEDELSTAETRKSRLEADLFAELLKAAASLIPPVMDAARELGELDAFASLASLSREPGWVFPVLDGTLDLEIVGGRHPIVDRPGTTPFTPNDLSLRSLDRRVLLITGPNMGGKSTYLRQAAILVILGQMGAPVPAKRARWGVFHSVHTRIGAHDAIARGQSTFMVEMTELAQILHQAGERSLLVLDEIGRGTSTYDGMSVAWAALEWIATQLRSRALFATHYHELTSRAAQVPGIANAHLAVEGKGSEIRFLYELRPGPASESFGIQVARMAGVPSAVVARASKVLSELERGAEESTPQLSFFGQGLLEPPTESSSASALEPLRHFLGEIAGVEIEKMTPLEGLSFLSNLRTKAQTLASSLPST